LFYYDKLNNLAAQDLLRDFMRLDFTYYAAVFIFILFYYLLLQ